MFVITCDTIAFTNTVFAKTVKEAMEKFDTMTEMYNIVESDFPCITLKEMGIFTEEDFLEMVVGKSDLVWCDTLEEHITTINNSWEDDRKDLL